MACLKLLVDFPQPGRQLLLLGGLTPPMACLKLIVDFPQPGRQLLLQGVG